MTVHLKKHECGCKKYFMTAIGVVVISAMVAFAGAYGLNRGTKTVIVDFEKVKKEAVLYKTVIAEQQKYEEKLQAQIGLDIGALQKEAATLQAKKKASTKEQVALQKKAAQLQQLYQYRAQQILAASQKALQDKADKIKKAFETVAQENGAGVILNASVVLYANDDTNNITDSFIQELNKTAGAVTYPNPDQIKLGE